MYFSFHFLFRLVLFRYVMLLEIRGRLSEGSWEQVNSSLKSKLINGSVMQRNEKWTPLERNSATWPKYKYQFCTNWFVVAYLGSVSEVPVFKLDPKTGSVDVFSSSSSNPFQRNADTDSFSFSSLSYDRSKASSKVSSPHSAIQSFLFQMRLSSPFLKVIQ
jgi:hypothetical protein